MAKSSSKKQKIKDVIADFREIYSSGCSLFKYNMLTIDLAYLRSSAEYAKRCIEAHKDVCAKEDPDSSVTPPLLLSQSQIILAYLAKELIDIEEQLPIEFLPDEAIKAEAKKLQKVLQEGAEVSGLYMETIQELLSVIKHNVGFHRIHWKKADALQAGTRSYALNDEGLRISTITGYNCIWDIEVPPKEFNRMGMYFEHTELCSTRRADMLMEEYRRDEDNVIDKSILKDIKAKTTYTKLAMLVNTLSNPTLLNVQSPNAYDDLLSDIDKIDTGDKAVKITIINMRATAKQLGLNKVADPTKSAKEIRERINLYKVVLINDEPVYIKELDTPYMEYGITTGMLDDFRWSTRSIIEPLLVYQRVSGKLLSAKMKTLNRAIGDRAIYNPLYIDPEHLEKANEESKLPIRRAKWSEPDALVKAYRRIPFEDHTSDTAIPDANYFFTTMANDATGASAFRRAPVRGQRSVAQATLEMQAADGRAELLANSIISSRGVHIRAMVKVLLLTHTPKGINWNVLGVPEAFSIVSKIRRDDLTEDLQFVQNVLVAGAQNERLAALSEAVLAYVIEQRTPIALEDFIPKQNTEGDTNAEAKAGTGENADQGSTGQQPPQQ